ncbi:MAG: 1-acyl-sn-glycerol-3-phosphate acyltransferase [Deltaproteobacteria bacterium]|nr:1-acyl-sn-glycerol-3-phosphate acyltransferase [Deltaproteobacteria bacterium]
MLKRLLSERPLRLPHIKPYVPRPSDPSIFWFNSERDDIVSDVVKRICVDLEPDRSRLEIALNDAAYHEIRRLENQRDDEARDRLGYWRSMIRRIGKMDDTEQRRVLHTIVTDMTRDVAGNFDPRVYRFARRAVPRLIGGVMEPRRLMAAAPQSLDRVLRVQGDVERLHHLQNEGSLVFVPTHSSNLDSIVLAQALEISGLSPVIYGAGKNLFTNPIISFFMHNLGAYRVDRRIRVGLYKHILKLYSQVMIERGYHSLFFPGGTRSRSGMIERHLKLGLLGSAVEAFTTNQVRRVDRPVWFVPTTINYSLVLEAETLIKDWLMEEGQARYIIEDDEFSQIDRWVAFFRKMVGMRGACIIRFGDPIDAFGNRVDGRGQSLTPTGRAIDPGGYVEQRGTPVVDAVRDAAYTRELGEVLAQRYEEDTVLMSTQVVAHVLFRDLVQSTPGMDLFARLRLRGEIGLDREALCQELGQARDRLCALEAKGRVRTSDVVKEDTPAELLERALKFWNGYHDSTAATLEGDRVVLGDPSLLLYYQNRLVSFAEDIAGSEQLQAACEIGKLGVHR